MPETVLPCSSRNRNVALPLSIYIIARNEADRIGATIRAVAGLSDDIVVVDPGSTDDTVAVATALGARVVVNAWPGYGLQKQFGEDQCRHDWLLNIDADEVVPPDMVKAIRQDVLDKIVATVPVKRLGEPSEIASIIAWLASEEGGYATGADFSVNGGLHMG
jgi:glycosyltransferase involved in cell wall biosynthesis